MGSAQLMSPHTTLTTGLPSFLTGVAMGGAFSLSRPTTQTGNLSLLLRAHGGKAPLLLLRHCLTHRQHPPFDIKPAGLPTAEESTHEAFPLDRRAVSGLRPFASLVTDNVP